MRVSEARKILGISDDATQEEARKAFKKLAAKYHPDVNKDADAETRFKEINTAMQVIEAGKGSDHEDDFNMGGWSNVGGFGGFGISIEDLIGGFGFGRQQQQRKSVPAPDIHLTETITFRESVLGCSKDIKFHRNNKCEDCGGTGQKTMDNGCTKCGGKGTVVSRNGNTITQMQCNKCRGQTISQACTKCSSSGVIPADPTITVKLPPGITADKNVLKMGRCGNFGGSSMMGETYSQVFLTVNITPQTGLSLEGNDVVCDVNIPLLDALQGCVRSVPTIDGNRDAIIPEGIRNKNEVILNNLGVARNGNQRIVISVEYPSNTSKLIAFLKEPETTTEETTEEETT